MRIKTLPAVLVPAALLCAWALWPRDSQVAAPEKDKASLSAKPEATASTTEMQSVDLAMGFEEKRIVAEFIGNGRERMKIMLMNKSGGPLRVTVPIGQMFESDHKTVLTVRPAEIEMAPGKTQELILQTAATRSSNTISDVPYQLSYATLPRLEPLLTFVQSRPELTAGSIQTAVLALTDNLPLSSVAKFTLASTPLPSRFNTDAFRAETSDIMQALAVLRDLKMRDDTLAMTVDPQLKIEAMIDANARPVAMRYYAIDPEREWDFWRNELLNGEPCTRHYALYGIARFYPDVAMEMLPRWAREKRTNPVYRLAAVQALADTQRPEALTALRELTTELGPMTELGKAAGVAADYLDYRIAQIAATRNIVAFRNGSRSQPTNF